jgi:hypothetical protein
MKQKEWKVRNKILIIGIISILFLLVTIVPYNAMSNYQIDLKNGSSNNHFIAGRFSNFYKEDEYNYIDAVHMICINVSSKKIDLFTSNERIFFSQNYVGLEFLNVILIKTQIQAIWADKNVTLDFFYGSECGACADDLILIQEAFQHNPIYKDRLSVNLKDVNVDENFFNEWKEQYQIYFIPFVVIISENEIISIVDEFHISEEYINNIIENILKIES